MAGLSSHCIEVRNLSLNRAHVAHEQFSDCWPLPQIDDIPALKVLSASLTADHQVFLALNLSDPNTATLKI